MAEMRRLRGHTASATCCVASRSRPGIIATGCEDGRICLFDMRCKDPTLTMEVGNAPVSSLCFKSDSEDMIFASLGTEVKCFDVHQASSSKSLKSYIYNREEINQVVCNSRSSFLASADDSGDIKIIDIHEDRLYKTLRSGHSSICSSVQFIPWRPWSVITGGLDSKVIMWDFSKVRSSVIADYGKPDTPNENSAAQCVNPAFVHALAISEGDAVGALGRICAVGRGDGVVDLICSGIEACCKGSRQHPKLEKKHQSRSNGDAVPGSSNLSPIRKSGFSLGCSSGGHTAAVSCLTFSLFGEEGKFIISGGNDRSVKVWNATRCLSSPDVEGPNHLALDINITRKVNWLCTTPSSSENLVVCDTSKVVKVYTIL